MSHRNPAVLGEWGPDGTRALASDDYWRLPFKWERMARNEGRRHRVFCLSLGDWLEDRPELIAPRSRLLETIAATPTLDWLLLTKRPEGWRSRMAEVAKHWSEEPNTSALALPWLAGQAPPNVWLGVSTENQEMADQRIPRLLAIPAAVRFISAEPLLGPIDLTRFAAHPLVPRAIPLDWVIVGGESGPEARPMHPQWVRDLRDQCRAASVAFFLKQWGEWVPLGQFDNRPEVKQHGLCWLEHAGYKIGSPDDPDPDGLTENPALMVKVGKHAAGDLLDGREHHEFPRPGDAP